MAGHVATDGAARAEAKLALTMPSRDGRRRSQMVWSETVFFMWSTDMGIVHIGRKQSLTYWFGINEQNRLKNGICVILCPT